MLKSSSARNTTNGLILCTLVSGSGRLPTTSACFACWILSPFSPVFDDLHLVFLPNERTEFSLVGLRGANSVLSIFRLFLDVFGRRWCQVRHLVCQNGWHRQCVFACLECRPSWQLYVSIDCFAPVLYGIFHHRRIWWVRWREPTRLRITLTEDRLLGVRRRTFLRRVFHLPSCGTVNISFRPSLASLSWETFCGSPLSQEFNAGFRYGRELLLLSEWIL